MGHEFLIVEDNADDAFLIRRAFMGSACRPFVCRNASEARAYLLGAGIYQDRHKFPFPEVVVSDVKLGGESGIQFLEWVRSQREFKNLPVIILTGTATAKDAALARQLGAVKVLTKPSDPIALHDLLVKVIRQLCPTGLQGSPFRRSESSENAKSADKSVHKESR